VIKEIVLRRFKRFTEERFDLSGHVILAGPNNCGKTTVLQALAAWGLAFRHWRVAAERLSAAEGKPAQPFVHRPHGSYEWVPIARQAFSAVPLPSFDLLWHERQYSGVAEIDALLDSGKRVGFELQADSTEQIRIRPKRDVDAAILLGELPSIVYVATIGGLAVEEPVYQADYIETILGRQRPGDVIRNLLLLAADGPQWEQLKLTVSRMFGVELLAPTTAMGGQIVCEYRRNGGRTSYDITSAGSGLQQVLLLLACLSSRQGALVLVDEPDAHLHSFLQDSIFAELNRAAALTKSQLVIATHSEVIFNSADPEQISILLGRPRRLASPEDVQRLRQAVAVLQQSELVQAQEAPGILYLDGYTDLNLLREWARLLSHPLAEYLDRTPLWRAKQAPGRTGAREVPVREHFEALQLASQALAAVWLLDSDGKQQIPVTQTPMPNTLSRMAWRRYESESYLAHPAVLARFIDNQVGTGGEAAVLGFFRDAFDRFAGAGTGATIADAFIASPLQPAQLVERYFAETKARTEIIGAILETGGVHGLPYTQYSQIAAMMRPEEVHPEVKEKLDFIQQAFGL